MGGTLWAGWHTMTDILTNFCRLSICGLFIVSCPITRSFLASVTRDLFEKETMRSRVPRASVSPGFGG